jgi:hypothetical protein
MFVSRVKNGRKVSRLYLQPYRSDSMKRLDCGHQYESNKACELHCMPRHSGEYFFERGINSSDLKQLVSLAVPNPVLASDDRSLNIVM